MMDKAPTEGKISNLEAMVISLTELLTVQEQVVAEQSERIRENEARFRAIYDGSYDAVMLLTSEGFFDCNPSTLEIFKIPTREEFIQFHPAQLSPPTQPDGRSSVEAANAHIETAFTTGHDQFEWVHRRATGEDFPAEVLLSAFEWGKKRVLQATVRDISERVRSEQALKESNEMFLAFIKEAAMRLKNPMEVVGDNLALVIEEMESGEAECHAVMLQLRIQVKNLEQIRQNIIELNKAIVERSGNISEPVKKFLTE